MSGRIWVVEYLGGPDGKMTWHVLSDGMVRRVDARCLQRSLRSDYPKTRIVQYVRQGGAR